ncbi:MAG: decaprenyl-phosphate phosphoribosyltransferase [Desulfomonile tiedjei]|uniref:Decaprenyl-phosphate phosphoribosyltransferase n=1 Tax=Desulfomonile tiedjei TaxID=2358 RepID=A0A9D6UZ40_9BACT|nr:decaprenyl-phosphate phosphoribosyltransferase [Desulfomonile tiedjei]
MPAIKLMRPTQWIKNGFVLMPLIFSGRLFHWEDATKAAAMLVAFCFASSATYIFNDYMDMEQDKVHPRKKHRPLASGKIAPVAALSVMVMLIAALFLVAAIANVPPLGYLFLVIYLVIHVCYSLKLKDLVIVDVLTISAGFLIRVLGGAVVLSVAVSSWLILCTFSVAIFLALGKRRHEVMILSDDASSHRPVLEDYNVALLDQLVQVATTSTFIFYCLYSVRGNPAHGVESEKLAWTIPLVTYGIFRYLFLIYHKEDGGSPTELLLTDAPLLFCVTTWLIACTAIIYC